MKRVIKILLLLLSLLVVLLVLTNPSIKNLKEFTGDYSNKAYKMTFTRKYNFLVFSIFNVSYSKKDQLLYFDDWQLENKMKALSGDYYGVFMNFKKINNASKH